MKTIVQQKLNQAIELLTEQNVDVWITFVRETSQTHDPALDVIVGFGVTWVSAFIVTKGGEKIALVGRYDADNINKLGAYTIVLFRLTLRKAGCERSASGARTQLHDPEFAPAWVQGQAMTLDEAIEYAQL